MIFWMFSIFHSILSLSMQEFEIILSHLNRLLLLSYLSFIFRYFWFFYSFFWDNFENIFNYYLHRLFSPPIQQHYSKDYWGKISLTWGQRNNANWIRGERGSGWGWWRGRIRMRIKIPCTHLSIMPLCRQKSFDIKLIS